MSTMMPATTFWEWMTVCSAEPSMACRWPELMLFATAAKMPRERPSAELGSVSVCSWRMRSAASSRPTTRLSWIRSSMSLLRPVFT